MRLPDFLIIGAAKAGTTAATINLRRHPEIDVLPRKRIDAGAIELHFFSRDNDWRRSIRWYAKHFNSARPIVGGKSTDYLSTPSCHGRLHAVLPNAKLIVFLREPVARAYSHWNHFNQEYGDGTPNVWRIAPFAKVMGTVPDKDPPWYFQQIKSFSVYAEQLESLYRFYPREHVYIAICERVKADMDAQYARMWEFLGVSPRDIPLGRHVEDNVREYPAPLDEGTRATLRDFYRPHNEKLFNLLGGEVPEWA
jgi:hypothetical protein